MTSSVEPFGIGSHAPAEPPAPARPRLRAWLARAAEHARASRRDTRALVLLVGLTFAVLGVATAIPIRPRVLTATCEALLFATTAAAFSRMNQSRLTIAIVLGGLAVYLAYLGYTSYGERNYDPDAQLGYIEWIVAHQARPPATHCLVCHHPPLYYALGAGVYALCKATRLTQPVVGLQVFSLLCFLAFVAFAVLTIGRLVRDKRAHALATALVVFWPYSVVMSVRVHNDVLACTLMTAALYYAVRHHQDDDLRSLVLATVFTALCVLTKSSGYVLVLVLLVVHALHFRRSPKRRVWLARAGLVGVVLAAALALNTVGKGKSPVTSTRLCEKVLGNACDLYPGQFVGNDPFNYVYLDLKSFLAEPYMLAEREGSGRQFFLNHFLKSSLFATHNKVPDPETSYALNRAIAGIMNAILLAMVLYLFAGTVGMRKRALRPFAVAWLTVGSAVLLMVGFRALVPAPHHADFRHVFPILVPLSLLYATVVDHHKRRKAPAHWVGYALATPFIALSIVYFVPKRDLVARFGHPVLERDLAAFATVVPAGTPWDKDSNLRIEDGQLARFKVKGAPTASEIDVSLDNNDTYEVKLVGATETRTVTLGPEPRKRDGLARYVKKIEPPVRGVKTIEVRPVKGDFAYAVGHFILR